jgi:hypothetical protein
MSMDDFYFFCSYRLLVAVCENFQKLSKLYIAASKGESGKPVLTGRNVHFPKSVHGTSLRWPDDKLLYEALSCYKANQPKKVRILPLTSTFVTIRLDGFNILIILNVKEEST